ncbi:MAG TPA: hypothetical protein VL987_12210 [Cellvibrio sp.]|nr:hypothetical protein [Cellvibrio sp.]
MKFQNTLTLLGVVGKKGSGKLDNGQDWKTDRVELHFLTDFDLSDAKTAGQTVVVYKLDGFDANYERARGCVGQRVVCEFQMVTSTKPGAMPRLELKGFAPERVSAKAG